MTKLDLTQLDGHTPGPWGAPGTNVYAQQGRIVATAEAATYPLRVANARLIAAAPSLLALARTQQQQIERLREALSKADAMRPVLLRQYQAVPECVLMFCNEARAALKDTAP